MKFNKKVLSVLLLSSVAGSVFAEMPAAIIKEKKAIVPVTKTEVITTVDGQEPIRTTEATVLEVKNQGKDIVAHDIVKVDNKAEFSKKQLSVPHVKEQAVIVPTTKIEEKKVLMQGGQIIGETKKVDATGVEFKKGHAPVKKELKVGSVATAEGSATRAVVSTDGKATKEVTVVEDEE
ncbi:hypothetical protein [Acinetobacter sp. ANC 3832]|uniref:hypothetical protein n=1 Tax=Acinetobacter sp. ANC 3832 TaxID=1977874 RepID=UPI000A34CFFD|nr:hypothetical protein [Acinetobacter sp. ANC 3832]OTG96392.1 hypothetical protein B9T35_01625 [Acinetobacter sp. ANC 3832]